MPILIGICAENSFDVYIDNHIGTVTTFYTMYIFLYNGYFPRIVFGPVYLLGKKIKAFIDTLKLLRFEKSHSGLKSLAKYCNKIEQMPILILRKKLNTFLWLTFFFQIFIFDQATLVIKLYKAYLKQILILLKEVNIDADGKSVSILK